MPGILYLVNISFVSLRITPRSSANNFVKSTSLEIDSKKSCRGPSLQCPLRADSPFGIAQNLKNPTKWSTLK